jgi:hypothetical protein
MQAQSERTTRITLVLSLMALLSSVLAAVSSQRAVIHELGGEPAASDAQPAQQASNSIEEIAASVRRVSDVMDGAAPQLDHRNDPAADLARRADTFHL